MDAPGKIDTVTPDSLALVDAYNGLLKVYITLCTGAVVLFVNAILIAHISRWALLLLAISTISFGLASLLCLSLLTEMINFRTELVQANMKGVVLSQFNKRLDDWSVRITGIASKFAWLFRVAIISAAAFVLTACLIR